MYFKSFKLHSRSNRPVLRQKRLSEVELAGMAGFEPTNARVKVWCLTAWRHPNMPGNAPAFGHTEDYSMAFGKKQ